MPKRNTDEMNTELEKVQDLKRFLDENVQNFNQKNFSRDLNDRIRSKGISKAELAKAAGMSEVYLHQILSGRRAPSRLRMICICIGLGLSLEETQKFLIHSGMGPLYAKNRWDAVIIYGINNKLDLYAINDLLYDANEETMF